MRCVACDKELFDHEARRKALFTREYIDLCDECYVTIADDVPLATGNNSLDDELREHYVKEDGSTEVSGTDGTDDIPY